MTPDSTDRRPTLDLSMIQVVAAALGAVAATALAGRLHLAGTLLGAAVVAVVATVATALVTLWLRRGRHRIRRDPQATPAAGDPAPHPASSTRAATAQPAKAPPSARSKAVLAGVVGGITAAALLTASGHGVLDVRIDAGAVEAVQRGLTAFAENVRTWAARA